MFRGARLASSLPIQWNRLSNQLLTHTTKMNSLSSFNCNKSIIGKFINRSYSSTTQSKTELGNVVSVKAYYVARGIDIMRIHSDLYRSCRQEFQAKSLTITLDEVGHQYITMFKYGSVIMYNLPEEQHLDHLRNIKSAAHTLIDEGLFHTEDYEILVTESLGTPAVVKGEYLHLGNLDSHNVAMISEIMAQTVALDYYADVVDKMLAMFMQMNSNVEATGNFKSMKDQALLKLIASNNTVMTNVLSQLGLFEGTDAAWESSEYSNTWETLRKDFEVDSRFRDLQLKLNIMKDNSKFFLDVLHNQKTTKLEWIIIILIAAEMVIGLCGLVMNYKALYPNTNSGNTEEDHTEKKVRILH